MFSEYTNRELSTNQRLYLFIRPFISNYRFIIIINVVDISTQIYILLKFLTIFNIYFL